MRPNAEHQKQGISVAEFIEHAPAELELSILAGAGGSEGRRITSVRIQKLGLALAGFARYIKSGRIQIAGQSEISYLKQLDAKGRVKAFENLDVENICCIVLTTVLQPPAELCEFAEANDLPLLRTPLVSSRTISLITDHLQERLAPTQTVHGVLMEMYGIGVMLLGESGIGKSECALDLISRGHRLVTDDVVRIKRIGKRLYGESPELTCEFLEIRGLGIVNIRELFGVSSICGLITIELCIELRKWNDTGNIERIGLDMSEHEILGISTGKFVLPVSPGRNLSTLVETAVRVFMLRATGSNPVAKLIERHDMIVGRGPSK